MNKLGVHGLVWVGGWSHTECERAIAQSAELGFDLIEIAALDPSSIDGAFTRKMLDRYKIGTTMSLGLDESTDISSGAPGKMARGEAQPVQLVGVGGQLGPADVRGILHSAFRKA